MEDTMSHLHLELSASHDALVEKLGEICDLKTKKDIVENALMLLGWAASEAANGLSIAAVDEKRSLYREVETPALQNARLRAELLEKTKGEFPWLTTSELFERTKALGLEAGEVSAKAEEVHTPASVRPKAEKAAAEPAIARAGRAA